MRRKTSSSDVEKRLTVTAEKAAEVFPTVRYFQIHFEYLQEQLKQTTRSLEALQLQIQQLQQQIGLNLPASVSQDVSGIDELIAKQELPSSNQPNRRRIGRRTDNQRI